MCSRHTKLDEKKSRFKKSSLSATALEYYTKYGQNRDLEKYLRVQRRSASKSSSDGSLLNADRHGPNPSGSNDRNTKSLDELSPGTSKQKDKSARGKQEQDAKQSASADEAKTDRIKIQKKTLQNINKKTKSKSYSFNSESNIEITFPPEFYIPQRKMDEIDPISKSPSKMLTDSGNQTEETSEKNSEMVHQMVPIVEIEGVPLPKTPRKDKENAANIPNVEVSPTSSIASNKMRLEWDSMADVGYRRVDMNSENNLSTYERSALVKFFAKRGLTFDDNLVIFATPDKSGQSLAPKTSGERPKSKESLRDKWKRVTEQQLPNVKGVSPNTNKRLWEKALTKYRQKYGKPKATTATDESSLQVLSLLKPQSHSTPISLMDLESIGPVKIETKDASHMTTFHEDNKDMGSQTSQVSVEAKGIQVEGEDGGVFLKFRGGESETSGETSRSSHERESASIASFEFCSPSEYMKHQKQNEHKSLKATEPISEVEEDDKVPSIQEELQNLHIAMESKKASSILTEEDIIPERAEHPANLYAENEKENIPPDDSQQEILFPENNKENIPPATITDVANSPPPRCLSEIQIHSHREAEPRLSNESILPDDLQKAVEMLNILVATRQIDVATKKKLMRRVVKRLLKAKYGNESDSIESSRSSRNREESSDQEAQESEITISGIQALSLSNAESNAEARKNASIVNEERHADRIVVNVANENEPKTSKQEIVPEIPSEAVNEEDAMKDWLAPMTYSEIQFMNQKILTEKQNEIKAEQKRLQDNLIKNQIIYANQEQLKIKPNNRPDSLIENDRQLFEREKLNHLYWIDREIDRLKNLKDLMNKNDDEMIKIGSHLVDAQPRRVKSQDVLYTKAAKNTIECAIDSSSSMNISSRSSMSTLSNRRANNILPHSADSFTRVTDLSEWNSHINMLQIVKNRTKLQTPSTSDDSIQSYAKAKRQQFLSEYTKTHENVYSNNNRMGDDDEAFNPPIYTKPYSADHYSEPRRNHMKTLSKQTLNVDAYTSITGSNGFLSSNSISIAVPGNSTSNTTTHQYDNRTNVAVQTTDTLTKTKPIWQVANDIRQPPTMRVTRLTNDKQQQARPKPLAYVITFVERQREKTTGNAGDRDQIDDKHSGKETDNHLYGRISSSSESYPSRRPAIKSNSQRERKFSSNNASASTSIPSLGTDDSDEHFTLQEYLQRKRPDFYSNAEERRKCVNELHNLRHRRNEQRKKLFALNSSRNMLKVNMKRLLPPPPLAQTRLFTSKGLRERTRRQYQNLPEVRQKQHVENENKIRKNHRIFADMFNKNLQKRVLKGQTDLSNSMSVQQS